MRLVASNKQSFKKQSSQSSKRQIYKSIFFVHSINILKSSLNELKQIAKMRGFKGYKSMSGERLISSINESGPVKEREKNFNDTRIEKIKKNFNKLRDRLSKSKIKEIRKYLYIIENKKIKEIERNLPKSENFTRAAEHMGISNLTSKRVKNMKE